MTTQQQVNGEGLRWSHLQPDEAARVLQRVNRIRLAQDAVYDVLEEYEEPRAEFARGLITGVCVSVVCFWLPVAAAALWIYWR